MSVLVTGAAGFIGSHFVDDLLARGREVVGLDNFDAFYDRRVKEENLESARDHDAFTLIDGDIRDDPLLGALPDGIDGIVHLAARAGVRPSIREPALYTDVNLRGTSTLLEFARTRGVPAFVFASSSSVYGNNREIPFRESDSVDHPISPYAATKKGGELLCHAHSHLHGTACMCLRFFTAYGPRQRPDLAIRKFSRLLLADEPIPRFGNGATSRDYTFVSDVVDGVRGALARVEEHPGTFDIVNLGEARTITLREMIRAVGDAFGRIPRIDDHPEQPGDVERTYADITKARELLGYRPSVDFDEGMRRFAEWYIEVGARQDGVRLPG